MGLLLQHSREGLLHWLVAVGILGWLVTKSPPYPGLCRWACDSGVSCHKRSLVVERSLTCSLVSSCRVARES